MRGGWNQLTGWRQLSHAIVNTAIMDYCESFVSEKGSLKSKIEMRRDVSRFLRSGFFKDILCQLDPRLNGVTVKAIKGKVMEYRRIQTPSVGFYQWVRGMSSPRSDEPSWWGPEGGEI